MHVISIIDDDVSVREAVSRLLRSAGYDVFAFASADDFLSSKSFSDTHCVIADVQMPGLSGIDLQRHLNRCGYKTPLIFMTAYPDERAKQLALNAGARGYFSKPFAHDALLGCIQQVLKGGQ